MGRINTPEESSAERPSIAAPAGPLPPAPSSGSSRARARWIAAAFALVTAVFLTWLLASRFVLSNDEGIPLEGTLRILRGQAPYRDFFVLMGPGTYWLQALALRTLGVTLAASRATVIFDLSVLSGCIVWLIARRAHPVAAIWFGWLFVVFETAQPVVALPNHRWDSAAFAMLAVTLLASGPPWPLALLAGASAAFAAWITPTTAVIGAALLVWLAIEDRSRLPAFSAGAGALTILCGGALAAQHALKPMIDAMLQNWPVYGTANRMMYGSLFGGYVALLKGDNWGESIARILIVLGVALPAILPPVALALLWPRRRDRQVRLLAVAGAAYLASAYPRMDVQHLVYTAPVFYVLFAWGVFGVNMSSVNVFGGKMRRMANAGALAVSLLAAIFMFYGISARSGQVPIDTRVGRIWASGADAGFIEQLTREVPPGDRLFCFPYRPMCYFLTLADNPTRYSYLQPGMMTGADEAAVVADLAAHPPDRVLYEDISAAQILTLFPASNPAYLRYPRIEDYLATRYRVRSIVPYSNGAMEILERRQ